MTHDDKTHGDPRHWSEIAGVGRDAQTTVNAKGGRQSHLPYRFDLTDPLALFELARVLGEGVAKYGEWNWRDIPVNDHINHALVHLYAFLAGDTQDDHLAHAFCRVMMALSLHLTPGLVARMTPHRPGDQK